MEMTLASALDALTRDRLFDLARVFGLRLAPRTLPKRDAILAVSRFFDDRPSLALLDELSPGELRRVAAAHAIEVDGRARRDLVDGIAKAVGIERDAIGDRPDPHADGPPPVGAIVLARGRQWMVESTVPGAGPSQSALVRLSCLDDDMPGRELELLWDLEIGARTIEPAADGLGEPAALDAPAWFGAYLHALKWSAVSAADARIFQSPFRAGIKLTAYQLTPLMKALELPRANLFIADDVGLGKTIEAGLVLQELILRQQADFVLIVCPAALCLQWRDEMMRRFGLAFQVLNREYVDRQRVERGFGVNPWATHNRFIVSYPVIRRPDYRDPLLARLGDRANRGLLILDEAHVAAPASASKYALDSDTTRTVRDLAPKFDNRLFLSATPHNGHSNSFSALLEILDPVRFTRGVPISGPEALEPIMVRRLKRDLRKLDFRSFPERLLVKLVLTHEGDRWRVASEAWSAESPDADLGDAARFAAEIEGPDTELEMARLLERYTELRAPTQGRARLVFVNLQKRLLSSPEAFARTLRVHARAVARKAAEGATAGPEQARLPALDADDSVNGTDEEALEALEDRRTQADSAGLAPSAEADGLLETLRSLAEHARQRSDAKALTLLAWLREHACPAAGDPDGSGSRAWSDRRIIVFTEYADTRRYLMALLDAAIAHTERGDERVLSLHGGMGDESRDLVQRAFNASPETHPVRVLIATDAAREGVNLQAHCSDLFHYDMPWNPSRLEQRNGRIDRTLQPEPRVRCHYFTFPQRLEDRVLDTVMRKMETVQGELGSAGAVLFDSVERTLEKGLNERTLAAIESAGDAKRTAVAEAELEAQRRQGDRLAADIDRAASLMDRSRRALAVDPEALRSVVNTGLELAGTEGLVPGPGTADGAPSWHLPEEALGPAWARTLDLLRPVRGRDEPFMEWHRRPPRPVTFHPLQSLGAEEEHLHLSHPLVKRVLDRFLSQGYGADDLSRVSAVEVPDESVARAVAYARLTLFGPGATRLHDEVIAVAAPWSRSDPEIAPYKDAATAARAQDLVERALADDLPAPPDAVRERLLGASASVFARLWPHLEAEADRRASEAGRDLLRRAGKESGEIRTLLERQRRAIKAARGDLSQLRLEFGDDTAKDQLRQLELDGQHMDRRLERIEEEIESEPAAIEALYAVRMRRTVPVGLVFAWPESMS